jgi:penicillin-insensitive murein endopeptidase
VSTGRTSQIRTWQFYFHKGTVAFKLFEVHSEMSMKRSAIWCSAALALAMVSQPVHARPAKALFGAVTGPSGGAPEVHGGTAAGCIGGAVALPPEGPGWQVLRPARNRFWGHPDTMAFVARLGRTALDLGWPALLIGDIAQPRGGPMPSGHASHQSGIDVDIWLVRPPRLLNASELASPVAQTMVAGDRVSIARAWTPSHAALIAAAARDPQVERIFVNAAIKAELCRTAPAGDRGWLRRVRPWWGHDSHFHVRLVCPAGQTGCTAQAPLPPGEGCDDSLAWWFSDEALNPPPPKTPPPPKRDLTLADLPAACARLLNGP